MTEVQTELDAESVLMNAVLGGDGESAKPNQLLADPQDLDRDDETADGDPADSNEGDEGEAKAAKDADAQNKDKADKAAAASEDDYVEIPGEDGKEPTKVKLADMLAGYQEYQRFEAQKGEIVDRIEREATHHATERLKVVEQSGQQMATMIHAALQLLQAPQAPSTDMLNPSSQNYNPDGYHMAFANYQRATAQHQQAQGLAQQLMGQATQAQQQAKEANEAAQLRALQKAWPEFTRQETVNKFVDDMGKAYGFSPQELDDVLVDHRQALVARDALAFRAMKAKSGAVKAKVEARAPKIVRSGSSSKAVTERDGKSGKFVSGALAELKKSNSDHAAAAYFAGLAKAGRI